LALYERKKPTEDEVKRCFERVKRELERWGMEWVIDAVGGEKGLRRFVEEVLRRMPKDADADQYKWEELAQSAKHYVSEELSADANIVAWLDALSFKEDLKERGFGDLYLPPPPEEAREQFRALVDAIDRYVSDLLKTTTLEEARRVLAEKFPQLFEVRDLLEERDEYRARVKEEERKLKEKEKLIESYKKKVKDLGETIKRLEAELKRYEKYRELPPDVLAKYQDGLAKLRQVEEENRRLREEIARLEGEKKKTEEEIKKAKEEEAKKVAEIGEKIREAATKPPPDHLAVRFLMDYSREIIHKGKAYTVSGKTGEVKYIPVGLYETIKDYMDRGILPRFIEPLTVEEKVEVEKVEKPEKVETVVLSDSDYNKLWRYFEETITKKFRLSYRYVYAYKDEFNRTVERTVGFQENMKLVDELLEKIARDTLLMPKTKARKIVEEKPKWVRPPRVEVPVVGLPPPPPPMPIPLEPVEPMPFPRRLSSSEINIFMNEFKRRLIEMGYNPDNYVQYWIAFRDAWHGSWDEVLKRFEELIKAIKSGLPLPPYPRPMLYPWGPWKEIPRDVILHRMWLQVGKDMDTFVKVVNEDLEEIGMTITSEDVRRIVKEEWKKGEEMHVWLKLTPREYIKKILGVDPEDC
jgi:hypothetical protein